MNINSNYNMSIEEIKCLKLNDIFDYFDNIINSIGIEDFFVLYPFNKLNEMFESRHINIGVLYDKFCTYDINSFLEYIYNYDDIFKSVIKERYISDSYLLSKQVIRYEVLLECIKKCEELELYIYIDWFFLRKLESNSKLYLLKNEELSEDTIIEITSLLHENEKNDVFEDNNLSLALYDYLNLKGCLDCKMNIDVLRQPDFIKRIFMGSLIELKINISHLSNNNDPLLLESLLYKYYDSLINSYNYKYKMFDEYYMLLNNIDVDVDPYLYSDIKDNINERYMKVITNLKLSELIIDCLFKTNYYFFMMDLEQLFKYNETNLVLSDEIINFYRLFYNIDSLSSEKKIELYKKYKDKNLNTKFYFDMRKIKDNAYTNINNDLFKIDNEEYIDKELSNKYGITIYDLRNKEYYILLRNLLWEFNEETISNRSCYTLISNNNTTTIRDDGFFYGYSRFNISKVVHMNDEDAYSEEYIKSETCSNINKILTSKELVSGFYSEIQLINEKKKDIYCEQVPDFLVVKDKIDINHINECIRLNIPLVLIKSHNKKFQTDYSSVQYPNMYEEEKLKIKRINKYYL